MKPLDLIDSLVAELEAYVVGSSSSTDELEGTAGRRSALVARALEVCGTALTDEERRRARLLLERARSANDEAVAELRAEMERIDLALGDLRQARRAAEGYRLRSGEREGAALTRA
ncbi:MAG: hypothetical protein IT378_21170 [Sandaracinaceae bacterium]|nr:hypothetical protein [Sandaracinaceae bacterium]